MNKPVNLTEVEMIALLEGWTINEYPSMKIDGEAAIKVLDRAEEKLKAALPDDWEDRFYD